MRRAVVASGLGALTLLAAVTPVGAQVDIQVVDPTGHPIPSVQVDVFGMGELIGSYSTDGEGRTTLDAERWEDIRRISLHHLGYGTLILQALEIPANGVVQLRPEATRIEGFVVEGGELCPAPDEPRARRLWSEVADRYASDTGARAWSAYMSRYSGSVRATDLGQPPDDPTIDYVAAGHPGVIHGGDRASRPLAERVTMEGYAWPPLLISGTTNARLRVWAYPVLEREHAYHFASPTFGKLHDFSVANEAEDEVSLAFCANGRGAGATINGVITLVPGASFTSAQWRFSRVDPDEGAGGFVRFADHTEAMGGRPHLVSDGGYFFGDRFDDPPFPDLARIYARDGVASVRWFLHPTADNPCNAGLSFYLDPPRTPDGVSFAECIARHWRR